MRKQLAFALFIICSLALSGCFTAVTTLQAVIATTPTAAQGEYPLAVTFDASRSTGDIIEYLWVFGDGATGTGVVAAHTYAERGVYTVVLTVVARDGTTVQTEGTIRVHSKRPVARFTISPAADARAGMELMFNATASHDPDGTIAEYMWDFGDGTWGSTTLPMTTHTYRDPGQYTVTLVVKDNEGDLSDPATRLLLVGRGGCCGN